jgi:uncharacterized protein YeeX (DUF496 family)
MNYYLRKFVRLLEDRVDDVCFESVELAKQKRRIEEDKIDTGRLK